MTSSKKRKIKVTDEQKQMIESAQSFWSKDPRDKTLPVEQPSQPSQTIDQMMAAVNEVPEAPPQAPP